MYWDVVSVKPEKDFILYVKFADGLEGKVKFMPSRLKKPIFHALRDESFFSQVYIDHGIVTWPENLDLAPDTMHDAIQEKGEWILY